MGFPQIGFEICWLDMPGCCQRGSLGMDQDRQMLCLVAQ